MTHRTLPYAFATAQAGGAPEESGLVATGERAEDVLRLVRNYAV